MEILEKVELTKVGVRVRGPLVFDAVVKSLQLIVDELAGCNLPSAGDDLKGTGERGKGSGGDGNAAHDGCTMGASHAVDGDIVPLLNVKLYAIESACDGEVAAGNVREVTFDPFGICRDVKLEGSRAMISNLRGLFGISGGCETSNYEFDVRKLRWLSVLLAGPKVNSGPCRECDDGCVIGSVVNVLCLIVDDICGVLWFRKWTL